MEFLLSSKITHANGLSNLIPKHTEPIEDSDRLPRNKSRGKKIHNATLLEELPVTLGEIKEKAFDDNLIKEIKKKTR